MNAATTVGCGSGHCACAGEAQPAVASINGMALHEASETPDPDTLRERAYTELLRQQAVKAGLLPRHTGLVAPELDGAQRAVIEGLLDAAVVSPDPGESECRRYFDANKGRFIVGQALHVRHILFAVTPGVNVHALSQRAEAALLELIRKDVAPGRFEALAAELSNCPSSAQGGDLGWVTPEDCAPELANELFFQTDSRWGMGVHPRLVHTRFGLHIIEVLGRRKGRLPEFEQVQERIQAQLALQSRSTALRQYMQLLVGQAQVEGLALEGADSPLVQ
ncbi:MAG: peptidylprolyl isomerase [Hydrogenophaga sp.]|jgi:peptidyl-prolyl cis-trans isomerase C|uniref:peptidylprolyl isomerase n=1 Tax=Hydrogenophaga sp. TaxID=1904254 RepID=UPI00272525E3|nr:peptidylprolyl isomerase [Hydrogenophaga sp.]MDO9570396.1 peptidylprolyl isomerase [Hydrogenophaga sp.]